MMLQLALAIDAHAPLTRRSLDVASLKSHALQIFDSMAALIRSQAAVEDDSASFIFGGYSWIKKAFERTIRFDQTTSTFHADPAKSLLYNPDAQRAYIGYGQAEPPSTLRLGRIALAGDQGLLARSKLIELVTQKVSNQEETPQTLDMQPFEVVRDMLRDPERHHTIAGAPQVVKVYQYMQSADIGVYWPRREGGNVFLRGRPKLGYETSINGSSIRIR